MTENNLQLIAILSTVVGVAVWLVKSTRKEAVTVMSQFVDFLRNLNERQDQQLEVHRKDAARRDELYERTAEKHAEAIDSNTEVLRALKEELISGSGCRVSQPRPTKNGK